MIKKIIRALAFLLVLVLIYGAVDTVLKIKKDDVRTMVMFQKVEPNTIDVAIIGSSHAGMNIDNYQMWKETGIASFCLWGGMQPTWNSYHYLKECLKTQHPQVVMVDVFMCGDTADYSTKDVALKHVSVMPWGLNKIQMALASFEKWQEAVEALWGMPYYHSRYDELTEDDFYGRYGWDDEIIPSVRPMTYNVFPFELIDGNSIQGSSPLTEKHEKYLRKIIDLCKAEGIELVLMCAPYIATEENYRKILRAEEIAHEEGVPFLNFFKTWKEYGIDPSADYSDGAHFNNVGIQKFTRVISNYLQANYDLPDHRDNSSHPWYGAEKEKVVVPEKPKYALSEVFVGDGAEKYIKTDVHLFRQKYGSWTLLTQVETTRLTSGYTVYLSCFDEEKPENYRGLLLRQWDGKLQLLLGTGGVQLPDTDKTYVDLAIVKNGEEYSVYFDGQWVLQKDTRPCEKYNGKLLIGCQEMSENGEIYRHSATMVRDLQFYPTAWTNAQVEAWTPAVLPGPEIPMGVDVNEPVLTYEMPEQFMGGLGQYDQDNHIDTELKLFDDSATRFTLISRILPNYTAGNDVYLSCFDEMAGEYGGLLIRQTDPAFVDIVYGDNRGISVPSVNGQPMTIMVTKDAEVFNIYVDGQKWVDNAVTAPKTCGNSLLLGAQHDADGKLFRYSPTRVLSLQVYAGVMEEAKLLQMNIPDAPLPAPLVAPAVACEMEQPFQGNGADLYVDMGVKLFATQDMAWTLDTVLEMDPQKQAGVYLSCFCEVPGMYRGLLIRQEGEELNVLLGETGSVRIPVKLGKLHLVITRDGENYALYADGALVGRVTSSCTRYRGTLLVGAQVDENGELFRFSHSGVDSLCVTDGAMNEQDAMEASEAIKIESRF